MKTKHAVATMVADFGLIGTAVAQPHGGGPCMSGSGGDVMGSGMMNDDGNGFGMGAANAESDVREAT